MADRMTKEQRHRCMSHITGHDTKPELIVRKFLWHHGFRYRLYDKKLPGKPDIVMRKWKTVILVNGCFWHGHDCDNFKLPKSNQEFWKTKIENNKKRDKLNRQKIRLLGFRVITLWECELSKKRRKQTLDSLLLTLSEIVLKENKAKVYHSEENEYLIAAEPEVSYGQEN